MNPQGGKEIVSGFGSGKPLVQGHYRLGINIGEFKFDKKPYFTHWSDSPFDKKWITLELIHPISTELILQELGKVPWGHNVTIRGRLWFKDEEMPWSSGSTDLIGRKIHFTASNSVPAEAVTDAMSIFSTNLLTPNLPMLNCTLQAHYNGDDVMFDKCSSNTIHYDVIKHTSALLIDINNLRLSAIGKIVNDRSEISLERNQMFRITGILIDDVANNPINGKPIIFKTTLPTILQSVITLEDGRFSIINFTAPSEAGSYEIRAIFEGDDLYFTSHTKTIKVIVKEKQTSETNILEYEEPSYLITPSEPFSNEIKMRRTLRACLDYIYWIDKFFRKSGLEWLNDEVNTQSVKMIRILLSLETVDEDLRKYFKSFKQEMKNRNVTSEMRVVTDIKLYSDIHDRWIICSNKSYNVPSVDVIKRGQFSEILQTESNPPFNKWWKASSDIISDWNNIKKFKDNWIANKSNESILDEKRNFKVNVLKFTTNKAEYEYTEDVILIVSNPGNFVIDEPLNYRILDKEDGLVKSGTLILNSAIDNFTVHTVPKSSLKGDYAIIIEYKGLTEVVNFFVI
jgi:hypothetical protein